MSEKNKKLVIAEKPSVARLLVDLREEQKQTIECLGDMYEDYNLVMATSFLQKGKPKSIASQGVVTTVTGTLKVNYSYSY